MDPPEHDEQRKEASPTVNPMNLAKMESLIRAPARCWTGCRATPDLSSWTPLPPVRPRRQQPLRLQPARLAAAAAGQIGTMRSAMSSVQRRCTTITREIVRRRRASLIARSLSSSRSLVASSSSRMPGPRYYLAPENKPDGGGSAVSPWPISGAITGSARTLMAGPSSGGARLACHTHHSGLGGVGRSNCSIDHIRQLAAPRRYGRRRHA
jgi:hypothetical protein